MLSSTSKTLAILLCAALLGACGSTSSSGSTVEEFGLAVCSLGCNGGTFSINTHPANKDIIFTFNDDVDPNSVNFSSISIVSQSTGATPLGSFVVQGRNVIFRPTLAETESGLTFGFSENEVYEVRLWDASNTNAVRSLAGRVNDRFVTGDISITQIVDLIPGKPFMSEITPDSTTAPTNRDFNVVMVFDDLLWTLPIANPETGESLLITVQTYDAVNGTSTVPGTFTATTDRDELETTVTFTPAVPWPGSNGGEKVLQVALSQQISDMVGNNLGNPGVQTVLLPDLTSYSGSLTESFTDNGKEDDDASTAGLWASTSHPGALWSGVDPTTGLHHGGGSGVLGAFQASDGLTILDTDSQALFSDLLQETVTVTGGVFSFSEVDIPTTSRLEATGSNPLRLFTQGAMVIAGTVDISGEDAPVNANGKYFSSSEWDNGTTAVYGTYSESSRGKGKDSPNDGDDDWALGGDGGAGNLLGGGGGSGGKAWYHDSVGFLGSSNYLNSGLVSWYQGVTGVSIGGAPPDPNRFRTGKSGDVYNGGNGDGVGGEASTGSPISASGNLLTDLENGAGMGSWAWPPHSGKMPAANFTGGALIKTTPTSYSGTTITSYGNNVMHRSRGGGGGGYWSDGTRGGHHDVTSTDPLGRALNVPIVDLDNSIREYNSDGSGGDYFMWDAGQAASAQIPDASGGAYDLPTNIHLADPESSLLLGGAGGGGAGMSLHGSIWDRFDGTPGTMGTHRNCPGAGGGAGGGAGQFHAGSRLSVTGLLNASGGDGGDSDFMLSVPFSDSNAIDYGIPGDAGGGGGSGGALLVQAGSVLQADADSIQVDGGDGGTGSAGNHGGDGGAGLVRFETATGLESLSVLEAMVSPDVSVNLSPIGQAGVANVGSLAVTIGSGDVSASDSSVFRANSSGVRSRWFEPAANVQSLVFDGWTVECEYSDGTTPGTVTYTHTSTTDPGVTPIWIAFQGGWLTPGTSSQSSPTVVNQTDWVIPGFDGVNDGFSVLGRNVIRALRFMIVFDHAEIESLIGTSSGAYFRVASISFDYDGD